MRRQRIVIGWGKSRHCQTGLERRFSWKENLQRSKNIELRNLQLWKKVLEKSSQFLSSDQPSEPISLDVALNIAGVEKYARKTWDCGQPGGHSIRVLTERKEAFVTMEICVLCGRWFSNQFEILSETPFSCDAVGCELLWAVLCSLLCRELDWNIRIGKQGYVQCLSDFQKWRFDFSHS